MATTDLPLRSVAVAAAVTALWFLLLSGVEALFDHRGVLALVSFGGFVLLLAVPAGVVVGTLGGNREFLESGIAGSAGVAVAIATLALGEALVVNASTAGEAVVAIVMGGGTALLLFPVAAVVGGYTARAVRSGGA